MKPSEAKPTKKARPLNLRDFPEDLYWKCKEQAAKQHMTLKQFIVQALQREVVA